jgi:hypothetical protein
MAIVMYALCENTCVYEAQVGSILLYRDIKVL